MTVEAEYVFEIDWTDTGNYDSLFSRIPKHHVVSYDVDYGSNLAPSIYDWGLSTGGSQLTLFDPDGLYYVPGEPTDQGRLTEQQLTSPHRWRLTVGNTTDRRGRAFPVFGDVLGGEVQPVTWRLAGPHETDLEAITEIEWNVGSGTTSASHADTVAGTLEMVHEQSATELHTNGIEVLSTNTAQVFEAVEWYGSWGDLLLQIGLASGGLLIELHDGRFLMQDATPTTLRDGKLSFVLQPDQTEYQFLGGNQVAIDRSSGISRLHNLVKTRAIYVPYGNNPNVEVEPFGDEDTYGVRQLFLNSVRPLTTTPEQSAFREQLAFWGHPHTYVRLDLADESEDDFETLQGQTLAMRPGGLVRLPLTTFAGPREVLLLVCRVELSGGHNQQAKRSVHGIVLEDVGRPLEGIIFRQRTCTVTRSDVFIGKVTLRTTVFHEPNGATLYWRYREDGPTVTWSPTRTFVAAAHQTTFTTDGLDHDRYYFFALSTDSDFSTGTTYEFSCFTKLVEAITDTVAIPSTLLPNGYTCARQSTSVTVQLQAVVGDTSIFWFRWKQKGAAGWQQEAYSVRLRDRDNGVLQIEIEGLNPSTTYVLQVANDNVFLDTDLNRLLEISDIPASQHPTELHNFTTGSGTPAGGVKAFGWANTVQVECATRLEDVDPDGTGFIDRHQCYGTDYAIKLGVEPHRDGGTRYWRFRQVSPVDQQFGTVRTFDALFPVQVIEVGRGSPATSHHPDLTPDAEYEFELSRNPRFPTPQSVRFRCRTTGPKTRAGEGDNTNTGPPPDPTNPTAPIPIGDFTTTDPNTFDALPTGRPRIVGNLQVGSTAVVDVSPIKDADGLSNPRWAYRWRLSGEPIATGRSWTVPQNLAYRTVFAEVFFSDDLLNRYRLATPALNVADEDGSRTRPVAPPNPTINYPTTLELVQVNNPRHNEVSVRARVLDANGATGQTRFTFTSYARSDGGQLRSTSVTGDGLYQWVIPDGVRFTLTVTVRAVGTDNAGYPYDVTNTITLQ